MTITTGLDLVYLPRFKKALKRGNENFLMNKRQKLCNKKLKNYELARPEGFEPPT